MIESLNAVAGLWWGWMSAMFWQVGLLIVLIACIDRVIRRWAWPQLRYALWSLVLLKLILPPTLSLPSGIVPALRPMGNQVVAWLDSEKPAPIEDCGFRIADSTRDVDMHSVIATPPWIMGSYVEAAPPANPKSTIQNPQLPTSATPQSEIHNPQLAWSFHAMVIWLAGTLTLGIWLLLRLRALAGHGANRAAAASLPPFFYNQMAGCAKRLGLSRIPRVVVVRQLATPAVFGLVRPVLLMPKGYLGKLSRKDTEHMLLHELAHIRRGDLHAHSLYMLLQIIYWYNPLLWLVRRQLHHLRELACDATVANLLREQTSAYRQTLLETARRFLARSTEPGLGLLGLFEDSNRLAVRLSWLEKPTWRYRTMKRITVIALTALMFACVLPMAQGQDNALVVVEEKPSEDTKQDAQRSRELAELRAKLAKLEAEKLELQKQLQALAVPLDSNAASGPERVVVIPAPPKDVPVPGRPSVAGQPGTDAQWQKWTQEMETWSRQMQQWEQSDAFKQWQKDMEKWSAEYGKKFEKAYRDAKRPATAPAMPAMPTMPPMPAIPEAVANLRLASARVPMDERVRYDSRNSWRAMPPVPGHSPATMEPMSTGLAGCWKLDAAQGAVAVDSSGYGRHGLLHGDPKWRSDAGRIGGALYLDGEDDYVDTGWAEHLPIWTIALWVKSPAKPDSSPTNGPLNRDANYQINWDHGDDNCRGATAVRVRNRWYATKFGELKADTWYHLAATYDGESLKAYKDGILVTENTLPSGPADRETETLKLGRHATVPTFFEGTIDEVHVFAEVLGPEEIKGVYSKSDPAMPQMPVIPAMPDAPAEIVVPGIPRVAPQTFPPSEPHEIGVRKAKPPKVKVPEVVVPMVEVPEVVVMPGSPAGDMAPPAKDARWIEASTQGKYLVKSLRSGATLAAHNRLGSVRIVAGEGPGATVKATVTAKGATMQEAQAIAEKVEIRITPTADFVKLDAQLPDDIDEDRRERIQVAFEVALPSEVNVQIAQKVGPIHLVNLCGEVKATAEVGDIHSMDLKGKVLLRTNVGHITMIVPSDISAKVEASTRVGSISSDLPLEISGAVTVQSGKVRSALGSSATGVLGSGEEKIRLDVNVGSIRIQSSERSSRQTTY